VGGARLVATVTEALRIGPMIAPLSRRRVQKVARETLTLGVGLGNTDGELIEAGP
jgi:hypothetical protein